MTAIAGILCRNGVVIGSDSSSTFVQGAQLRTIEQPSEKICIIDNRIIIAGTGAVGFDQRFCEIAKNLWDKKIFQQGPVESSKLMAHNLINDLGQTFTKPDGQYGALVAFPSGGSHHLCEFSLSNFQPELKTKDLWFCSMGATQYMTDPFLGLLKEVYWNERQPDLQDGIFAITWTIDHAIKLNVGGVNEPTRIAILESRKGQYNARIVEDEELQEYRQNIAEAKDQLRQMRAYHRGEIKQEDIPQVPKP